MSNLEIINTKKQAYLLIHDPKALISLLYSKYIDIEEDFNYLYLNQIIYNKSSHFNTLFKEYQYSNFIDEFLKKFYNYNESKNKIHKLFDYYRNYNLFFSKPIFCDHKYSKILHKYGDKQAEIFYKNNYGNSNEEEEEKESSNKSSLSSLDNLTNNKTIFNQKVKNIIDNNINLSKETLTLESSKTLKNGLISKRSKNDSFIKFISPIVNYQENKKKKKEKEKENKTTFNSYKKNKFRKNKLKQNDYNIKNLLYNLVKSDFTCENKKNSKKKLFLSPRLKPYLSNYKTNFNDFNKNKPKKEKISIEDTTKNKTYNNNLNSNFKNFSKLSITLNNNLNNILNNNLSSNSNSKRKNSGSISKNKNSQTLKNKTYDNKNLNSKNSLIKFNINFSSLNNQKNSLLNKKKISYGSNFNLIKNPISSLKEKKTFNFSKEKAFSNKNLIIENIKNSKEKIKEKPNKFQRKKNNAAYSNTINLNNIIFSSQKSTLKNTINTNRIKINLNNIYKFSRNKKHIHNNIKTFRKDITKSIDEKMKLNKFNFKFNNNEYYYQMSQRLIQDLKKKNTICVHDRGSKKSIKENLNSSLHNFHSGRNLSFKENNFKYIKDNLKKRVRSDEKKDKKIKKINLKK